MKYNLQQIAEAVDGKLIGDKNFVIEFILTDSRSVVPSEHTIFFAFKGERNDGHFYIKEMYEKGVRNFVVNDYFVDFQDFENANFIIVKDTREALRKLAQFHRSKFDLEVVAITGSNGKTIVKEWLSFFLSKFFSVIKSPKSFNSQIGVPLSVLEINEKHQIAVFEAGISKPNEMQNLEKIIKPKIGIFTNLGDAHQENFISKKQKLIEKFKLFKNVETLILNVDNELVRNYVFENFSSKKIIAWSKNNWADITVENCNKTGNKASFTIFDKRKNEKFNLQIPFSDSASVENFINVFLALRIFLNKQQLNSLNFDELFPVEMRLQQIKGINNCTLINDTYNFDLTSFRIALDFLKTQNQHKKKTVIFSDVFEVEADEEVLYFNISQMLKNAKVDRVIGIGNKIKKYANFFDEPKFFYPSVDDFLAEINKFHFKNEAILLKGARRFKFEKITNYLQLKFHQTVFEINLNAIVHNLEYFKSFLNKDTKIMVMVKAFSYGNGSFEIANVLQHQNVDYLGVAIVDEGIELRKNGIKIPIIVMNPDVSDFSALVEYNLEPEIYNFRILNAFYQEIKNKVHFPYPIHIKLDTGMHRLGFDQSEIDRLISTILKMPEIKIKSIFSHLAGSPSDEFDDFTIFQVKKFDLMTKKILRKLSYKPILHILNSAGIERFPQYQYDMVRLGIGLYGISAVNNKFLKNIGTLKTRIIQIRNVKKGETIGYDRKGKVLRDSKIGVIPIGYADGLNRRLSNGVGKVWINGKLAPIIGNICMDLTMIDLTDINARENDEVIIFGDQYPIQNIANQLQTIPYEVFTSISQRVKRIYNWE